MAYHPFSFWPHMNVLFLNLLIQMGVLHHLEEVMSLPPPLSPPSPAGMWRLLPHLWCTEERRALSPSTVSVSTVSSRPKINSLPLFDMAICIFLCLKLDRDYCFVCLPALVWCCLHGALQGALWCGVWVTLLMIMKPGGWWSIQTHFWLLPLRICSYDSDFTMLFVFYCSSTVFLCIGPLCLNF